MSAPNNKKAGNGTGNGNDNGSGKDGSESNDYTIAKVAGAVIASGVAWSLFKTFWPKKSLEEELESFEKASSGVVAEAKEKSDGFVETVKKFPKFGRKSKSSQAYEVSGGDTLYALARRYGVSVDDLKAANGLSDDIIVVGEKIKIPS